MKTDPNYNREKHLQKRLNHFLSMELGVPKKDYYSNLNSKSLISLKTVLADINNILTMKITVAFISWVSNMLSLDDHATEEMTRITMNAKPNSNGYDVSLGYPVAFVAEVKCNIPINGGAIYGSAQRKGIENDLNGLLNGKRKASILPHKCLKFFVFIDLPEVHKANVHLASVNNDFKEKVLFISDDIKPSRTDIIYGVYV